MLQRIIQGSVRNKFLVLLFTAGAIAAGVYAFVSIPVDALPDVSDVQVIIFTEWQGQPPQIVEDQVTYPLTTTMLAVANAKVVRGYSFFGLVFRLCDFSGRHRYLLGPQPGARISEFRAESAAAGESRRCWVRTPRRSAGCLSMPLSIARANII